MTASRYKRKRSKHQIAHKRRTPAGAPPGTLIVDPSANKSKLQVIGYGPDEFEELEVSKAKDIGPLMERWPVVWVNVDGLADLDLIRDLGAKFDLHSLALEDIVNAHQRPKVEEYADKTFIVARMVHREQEHLTSQVSLFLCEGVLLTFLERSGDCFELVRNRIRKHRSLIRERKADYLAYSLLDSLIDEYFPVLEDYGERLEDLEATVLESLSSDHIAQIHHLKRDLLTIRRAVWPMREMINALTRDTIPHVQEQTRFYLRDCYDHTIQLMDVVEVYREIATGLIDVYLSSSSARMNEIMKMLTIIATIFMPLGFIASLYGMNFDPSVSPWNMPELGWYFGYPYALLIMATIAGGMFWFFWRKGWIGKNRDRQ